jgi:hypothetical protein
MTASHCGPRNFEAFRGDPVRFGKLTMDETDSEFKPSLVNSVRVGYNRVNVHGGAGLQVVNPVAGDTSLGTY